MKIVFEPNETNEYLKLLRSLNAPAKMQAHRAMLTCYPGLPRMGLDGKVRPASGHVGQHLNAVL